MLSEAPETRRPHRPNQICPTVARYGAHIFIGNLYLYFKNMNKACVPYPLFLLCIFYIHWHARTFISHVEKTLRDFFSQNKLARPVRPGSPPISAAQWSSDSSSPFSSLHDDCSQGAVLTRGPLLARGPANTVKSLVFLLVLFEDLSTRTW